MGTAAALDAEKHSDPHREVFCLESVIKQVEKQTLWLFGAGQLEATLGWKCLQHSVALLRFPCDKQHSRLCSSSKKGKAPVLCWPVAPSIGRNATGSAWSPGSDGTPKDVQLCSGHVPP